jgi:geranylgeranylglycerol-phosphate geranylgeranyltransferase
VKFLRGTIELARPGSSLLLFAMIFIPVALRSHDLAASFKHAVPMLLISMCAFIANDLDDIEKDRVNHPERPLPSRTISASSAAVAYFICLAIALLTTRSYVPPRIAFLYYLTMTLTISYRYVVAFIPGVKAPYTAATISIPAIIVGHFNGNVRPYLVAIALFAFALGRELCMDIADRTGDTKSWLHHVDANAIAICAFGLQIASLLLVGLTLSEFDLWTLADLVTIAILMLPASLSWFRFGRYSTTTEVMKVQLLLGIYFLV